MIIRTQQPTSMGIHTRSWIFINTKNSHQKCKNPLCYWFVQNLKNWSRSQKVLTSLLVFIFGYKSMWCKEDWSVSGHLQHQNEFTHIICLCLLLLSVSNPFFLRGKIVIFSRKKKKKNFFYHVPSYSSPFWCTHSKRIRENIRLKLCDLQVIPVSFWMESKVLVPAYKDQNGLGPAKCGRSLVSLGCVITVEDVELHQNK